MTTPITFAVNGVPLYTPLPKQLEFHQCPARYPLFGGARGPGKSHAMRWHMHMQCMQVPGFIGLLLRRNLTDLRRSHVRYLAHEAQQLGATWHPNANGAGELHYPNGSLLELGHCQHDEDYSIYLSAQYDGEAFDELVTFTEYSYLMVRSSCRTVKPGLVARVLGATNPGVSPVSKAVPGLGEAWVKRRWIDHDVTLEEDSRYDEADYAYIPARLEDNPYLQAEDYEQILGSLPPELRRAYREGSWDIFVGQFFPEFDKRWHVRDVTAPLEYPRTLGIDWGYSSEGVCVWCVVLPTGQLLVEDEFVFNGPRRNKMVAAEVAQEIAVRNRRRKITVRGAFADPSMFHKRGHIGESVAETFAKNGVPLIAANNDRVLGWQKMRAWLRAMPVSADHPHDPWMLLHPDCAFGIRTIPQMMMDAGHPEDMESEGVADHWVDAFRYAIAGRPMPVPTDVGPQTFAPGTMGALKHEILGRSRKRRPLGARAVRTPRYAF